MSGGRGLPTTARAAVFEGVGRPFSVRELALEGPPPGGAVVQVAMATVCGSDVHSWSGRRPTPAPGILGHEMVGVLAALGDGDVADLHGEPLRVGDRVTWSEYAACWRCDRCLRLGLPQKCRQLRKYGHESIAEPPGLTGGFAQYCHLWPGTPVLRVPPAVTDAEAVTVNCAGATMAAVVEAAGIGVGDGVVIQGLGALGLWGVALARAAGAGAVIGLDVVEERLELAKRFGADLVLAPGEASPRSRRELLLRDHGAIDGADVVIETTGAASALREGLGLLRPGGRYVTAGLVLPAAPVEVDASLLVRGMLTVRGVHNYHPRHLARALDFAARCRDRVPLAELVGVRLPLDAVGDAFANAAARRGARTAIVPHTDAPAAH
jgi:putative phosphonate catabolism associated alcohol dehydrogenase